MTKDKQAQPFLSFYEQRDIIPVRQDARSADGHFFRRKSLYQQMGITPANVRGRRVIEFGPGTGDNATYIASLKPAKLVLVDGNPRSVEEIKVRASSGALGEACDVHNSDILSYQSAEKFDLVICEGTIPGQLDPASFLRHVASFADEDGIVIITTMSAESYLAEICRRIMTPLLTRDCADNVAALTRLTEYFSADLASLPGMTRRYDDWVLDNIIHPWTKRGELLPMDAAIRALADNFQFLSSSPRMLQDWRWFKSISNDAQENVELTISEYRRWSMYLLDYRVAPTAGDADMGHHVETLCNAAFELERTLPDRPLDRDFLTFLDTLRPLASLLRSRLPGTQASIDSFIDGMTLAIEAGATNERTEKAFKAFRSWFGRGQQYMSFLRVT
ncbi:class I SAM-dependent methyltransferase [Dongia sp.]|uniref:class I SAM-dependent methyltransferase n=1 Tax=Dongia sp. TaxID=1977262 RepID=UPI0035B11A6B